MKALLTLFLILGFLSSNHAQSFTVGEKTLWEKQAKSIQIIRDTWGVPHVYANTDADAVFGMMYVQCEDYFYKVEDAIVGRMGRESELQGKTAIYKDLWSRLYIDTVQAKKMYEQCSPYLKKLCDAYAAGINYYMLTHPNQKPKLLHRINPWVPLLNNIPTIVNSNLTESDIASMYPTQLEKAIGSIAQLQTKEDLHDGSNGWAISGKKTIDKNPILLINPHSEFYNRIEVQLVSKEGLNVYGAPFLGEFNIFQGFNEFCGWMHTVTLSDAKDLYNENIRPIKDGMVYEYDGKWLPMDSTIVTIYYKNVASMDSISFTTYKSIHGPIVAKRNNIWIAAKTINENIELLSVHWNITKSKSFKEFEGWLDKRVMTGTNTIYADRAGNIAYWHGNFVPIRNPEFDWTLPVPGNTSKTNWIGVHPLKEIPNYINPLNGWVQNCNSTPLYATGKFDSVMAKKPSYMLPDGHTPRAVSAIRQLNQISTVTIDSIIRMCHSPYLANGEKLIPTLIGSYDTAPVQFEKLKEPVNVLRHWNFMTDSTSVATTLAVLWVEKIIQLNLASLKKPLTNERTYPLTNGSHISLQGIAPTVQLALMDSVITDLQKDWGTWSIPWGKINRFQRNAAGVEPSDSLPSLAVTAAPSFMGSLNAYTSKKSKKSKVRYGTTGNTFVAVVSFGQKITAKSILTGGSSSNPRSKHFTDQAFGYINHQFKEVNFYKSDVLKHQEFNYHPGDRIY